ncbi:intradiol ring-cleavage dioxygenase [Sagittula sp. S175]|uniref:intradiol ring-cleavage dioxygenase n=1 Tax=Sagittula sp. S175 TaxID=3415129 RepID=UPI003C7D5960
MRSTLDRRALLAGFAASPFVATGIGAFPTAARAQASAMGLLTPNVCMVSTEVTEGPYYIDPDLVRADITEDREGIPMRLQMQVVTADCTPVEGARVDVWHCDARGLYSGVNSLGGSADTSGQTFLRGTQMTDARGITTFQTIYPGWYRGRTTHIHYKVFLDETTVLTSQIFFPDTLSEYLFRNVAPYNERGATRDTMNGTDSIAEQAGEGAFAAIREQKAYYDAALVVGINPQAVSEDVGMPGGPAGGPAGGPPPEGQPPADQSSGGNAAVYLPGAS